MNGVPLLPGKLNVVQGYFYVLYFYIFKFTLATCNDRQITLLVLVLFASKEVGKEYFVKHYLQYLLAMFITYKT